MRLYFFIFLEQWIVLLNQYEFTYGNPIIGQNVRRAKEREYNFVVSIMRITQNPNPQMDHECTGTLITHRDVLTNEHCVVHEKLNRIQIVIGSISLFRGVKYYPLWWKTYNQWCTEKKIDLEFAINDVSIIRLSRNVSERISPPIISTKSNSELYGLDVMMPGWGISNIGKIPENLETIALKVMKNSECENKAFKLEGIKIPLHTRLLCSSTNPFALMQFGDSGGPLLYMDKIIGINGGTFPRPQEDVNPEKVNIHFSIDYYRNFILDVIYKY